MKIVYLSSPYSNKNIYNIWANIHKAHKVARTIWALGAACISPCSNTAFMDGEDILYDKWLEGDLAILSRCDALFLNKGWEKSKGCFREKEYAISLGLPVFFDINELISWLNKKV